MEIRFGGSAVMLLWRSYRHQARVIDSSMVILMPTATFPVLLFSLAGHDGNVLFSLLLQSLLRTG